MEPRANPENPVRFGVFEADMTSGELRKSGVRLRLSGQPFQVLAVLLRNPGKMVSREDLKQELWPDDTFVDFENGVNTAIRKIRRVLDDSADTPRYVETLPRRGYRFIAPVDFGNSPEATLPNAISLARSRDGGSSMFSPESATITSPNPATSHDRVDPWRRYLPWLLFGITAMALLVVFDSPRTPPEVPLRKFAIPLPIKPHLANMPKMLSISPDGKYIAFAEGTSGGKLWLQNLEQSEARPLDHTEYAVGPFWSPDSRFIGFATNRALKTVAVQDGQVSRLCELQGNDPTSFGGGSWNPDGETIAFSSSGVVYQVPVLGGVAEPLIRAETQARTADKLWGNVRTVHFLPSKSGHRLLVVTYGFGPRRSLMVQDLDSGRREFLGPGVRPFYSSTGHLVYQPHEHSRTLMAVPFSPDTMKVTGEAFPIAHDGHYPSVAADGTLVYLEWLVAARKQLVWIDRRGKRLGGIGPVKRNIRDPDLSPDGKQVAVTVGTDETNQDIWVYDTSRGSASPVTTAVDNDFAAAWSPSGEDLAFSSYRGINSDIFQKRADGTGNENALVSTPAYLNLSDWPWDGSFLLFHSSEPLNSDIWYLKRNQDSDQWGEPQPFLQTQFFERDPKLSPNGRYVAYVSDISGEFEVYVDSFPERGDRVSVSTNGGTQPRWSRDGTELFYVEGDTLMGVSVQTTPSFSVGETTTLFSHPTLLDHTPYPQYDVSNDGQRFILAEPVGDPPIPKIRVVQNWFAEFSNQQQD